MALGEVTAASAPLRAAFHFWGRVGSIKKGVGRSRRKRRSPARGATGLLEISSIEPSGRGLGCPGGCEPRCSGKNVTENRKFPEGRRPKPTPFLRGAAHAIVKAPRACTKENQPMTKVATILACSFLGGVLVVEADPIFLGSSALAFEPTHQSLIVKVKKDKKDDDDDEDKPKNSKKAINCKKARCEPGMVVLDKPNKYGACCEAREGLPPPKAAEPEKCKFPGEVGTPPNCECPPGTEFMGYKGCLPKKAEPVGPSPKKVVQRICCTGTYPNGVSTGRTCGTDEAALRKTTASSRLINQPGVKPTSITCAPEK